MKILILTSADHPYANALLVTLIRAGAFRDDNVTVFEQTWIIPGMSSLTGLRRYIAISGAHYVCVQAAKLLLFRMVRFLHSLLGKRDSPFFPFDRLQPVSLSREVLQGFNLPAARTRVESLQPDLLLSLYSKEILPAELLRIPRYGSFNLHPALLPAYRGVSPTFWCLAQGESAAGVTLHAMEAGIDRGMILAQREMPVRRGDSEHALYMRCTVAGAELLHGFLQELRKTKGISRVSFSSAKAGSYHSLPTKQAVRAFIRRGHRFFRLREFLFPKSVT